MSRKRNEGEMTGGWFPFIFIVGGGLYLLMEKPAIFWLVVVPIVALIIVLIVKKCKDIWK